MMRKNILFVIPNLNGGGAERVVCNLINCLDKNIFKVSLFLFEKTGVYWDILSKDIDFYCVSDTEKPSKTKILISLYKVAKNNDLIISAMELFPTYCVSFISKLLNKKCIGWVHININSILKDKNILSRLLHKYILIKLFYNKLDKIITVSNGAKETMKRYLYAKNENKIQCIYNPIDINYIKNMAELPVEENLKRPLIIAIGRLERQKNFSLLLKAHKILLEKGIQQNLIIIGQGSQKKYLLDLVESLKIKTSVKFLGFKENPYKYLKQADVFVQSSLYEGLPTVLIEALILNVPIVATNCPDGAKEILDNGKYGLLVETNNVQALTNGIEYILTDVNLRNRYISYSNEAINRFDDKIITKTFEKIFIELITKS